MTKVRSHCEFARLICLRSNLTVDCFTLFRVRNDQLADIVLILLGFALFIDYNNINRYHLSLTFLFNKIH